MSEQDKRRGPQGVQGVQGVEGIEGQGTQGIPGVQGERGTTGPRGRGALPRNVTISFGVVVAVAFIILAVFALQVRQTRQIARDNRDLISASVTRASVDRELCGISKSIINRQLFILRQQIRSGQVFRAESKSAGVRGYFADVIPRWSAQAEAAQRELRDLGDCRS